LRVYDHQATFSAHPQIAITIYEQFINTIAWQKRTILCVVISERCAVKAAKAKLRSDPHIALLILPVFFRLFVCKR